jgi:LacI family transcriptional regulator
MCCNDIRSRHVLEICRVLGIRVPHDMAIVGCDNDEVICQGMDPMLSSVDPNAYRIGYEAAATLSRLLQGKSVDDQQLIPPLGIVPRTSSYTTPAADPTIAAALHYIYEKSDEPIGVREISTRAGMSRRTLERKFEKHVGYSIATAIRRAHIERAKQLLIDTDVALDEVAEASGLKYVRQLRIAFMRETGTSPSQFRRSFQHAN